MSYWSTKIVLAGSLAVGLGSLAGPGDCLGQQAEPPAAEQPEQAAKPVAADEAAAGAPEGEAAKTSFFATTTVTATGRAADAFEIATPVTVLGAEEIARRQPDNAADLLRDEAGVDVNGVGANQARPIIRGQRGLRVLFLENGLRLNNPRRQTDFGEITGLVDLDSVTAVEVVRGPASVLYGSDAIGGVLNLITRKPASRQDGTAGGALGLRWGSAGDQRRGQAAADGRFSKLAFTVDASYRDAGDYDAPAGRYGDVHLGGDTPVRDTGVRDDSLGAALFWQPAERHQLWARFTRYRADQTGFGLVDPGAIGAPTDFQLRILYPFQDFDRATVGYLGSALANPLADSVEVQAFYQSNERQLVNLIDLDIGPLFPGAPPSGVAIDTLNFTDLDTVGFRAEAIKVAGPSRSPQLFTYGVDASRDDSFNTDHSTTTATLRFPFPPFEIVDVETDDVANAPNATNDSLGVFVQDEISAGERLRFTLGGRFQTVDTRAEPTPNLDTAGLDFSDHSLVGAANVLYRVSEHVHLVGSLGSAFRAPNIIERLFNGPTPEGSGFQILNRDLTSERSVDVDLGLKYRRADAYFEAIYFHNKIDDGIVQHFLTADEIAALPPDVRQEIAASGFDVVVQQRNVDQLRYEGVEVTIGYRSPRGFAVGGNYTHLSGERVGQSPVPVEDLLADKVNLYARYQPPAGRFWVEYRLRHNGDQPTRVQPGDPLPAVGETLPAFTLHTLSAGARLDGGAAGRAGRWRHSLVLIADNLTDELYAEVSNASFFRPEPGRNVTLSYRVGF